MKLYFGKLQGQPLSRELVERELRYACWLLAQRFFPERYPEEFRAVRRLVARVLIEQEASELV